MTRPAISAIKRPPLIGWQTLLADLSLILFMVTGAALVSNPGSKVPAHIAPTGSAQYYGPAASEPLAVWRTGGAVPLRRWLAAQQRDPRQQLTITARYHAGSAALALGAVQLLVRQAGTMGLAARVMIEPVGPGQPEITLATLAYDQPVGAAAPPPGGPPRGPLRDLAHGLLDDRHPAVRSPS